MGEALRRRPIWLQATQSDQILLHVTRLRITNFWWSNPVSVPLAGNLTLTIAGHLANPGRVVRLERKEPRGQPSGLSCRSLESTDSWSLVRGRLLLRERGYHQRRVGHPVERLQRELTAIGVGGRAPTQGISRLDPPKIAIVRCCRRQLEALEYTALVRRVIEAGQPVDRTGSTRSRRRLGGAGY